MTLDNLIAFLIGICIGNTVVDVVRFVVRMIVCKEREEWNGMIIWKK